MNQSGPELEPLLQRLAETPGEFFEEPRIGDHGSLHVAALVNDVLKLHGARAPQEALARFISRDGRADRNRLALAAITAWLLAAESFLASGILQEQLLAVLDEAVAELAAGTASQKFVNDPDRREELVRIVLARLDYRPAEETIAQATDRLSSISVTERRRLLLASRAAEERARAIREALARKAAEEAADKWSRE